MRRICFNYLALYFVESVQREQGHCISFSEGCIKKVTATAVLNPSFDCESLTLFFAYILKYQYGV